MGAESEGMRISPPHPLCAIAFEIDIDIDITSMVGWIIQWAAPTEVRRNQTLNNTTL